jgi:hypothetical protein
MRFRVGRGTWALQIPPADITNATDQIASRGVTAAPGAFSSRSVSENAPTLCPGAFFGDEPASRRQMI